MTVRVLTDSASTLPDDPDSRHGIEVVPLQVHMGAGTYRDGEIDVDDLLRRVEHDPDVTTSSPSFGDYLTAIERASADGPVLVLTVASAMSSTYQVACLAARQVRAEVTVLDTRTAAGAQGLVALAAAQAAEAGHDLAEVTAVASRVADRVRLVATASNLERLARSGRVPTVARWLGRRIGVHVLFELRDGSARPLLPARTREAALARIVQRCIDEGPAGARLHVAVLHALDPQAARRLGDAVAAAHPASCFVGSFSSAMVVHTGAGLVGLAWWWQDDAPPS